MKLLFVLFCLLAISAGARPSEGQKSEPVRCDARPQLRPRLYQTNYPTDYLTTTIQIGTPPQTFTVAVDTWSWQLWVFDQSYPNAQSGQHTYNANASSTSQRDFDDEFYANNGVNIYANGYLYQDEVALFGLTAHPQMFGSVTEVMNENTGEDLQLPFDGILGVSWLLDTEEEGSGAAPIENALQGMRKRQFTIWFNSTLSTRGVTESKVTIGGNDPDHCQLDNIFDELYVPLWSYQQHISIILQTFSFDQHFEAPTTLASLDTSSPILLFPAHTYRVQPDFDWTREILTVDCSKQSRIPEMIFTINNVDFVLNSKHFVVDVGLDDGQCAFAVGIGAEDWKRGPWALGTPFHREYCLTYDLDAQTVLINLAVGEGN